MSVDPVRKVGSRRKVAPAAGEVSSNHESTLDQLGKQAAPEPRTTYVRNAPEKETWKPSKTKGVRVSVPTERSDQVLNVPNILSFSRILMVPLFLWLVLGPQRDALALLVLVVSGLTDYLDGKIARSTGQITNLGVLLDPIADRLFILAVVVALAMRDIIPWWLALSLPLRDLCLIALVPLLRTRGFSSLPVHFLGKAATAVLLYAFPLLLLGDQVGSLANLARVFGWAFSIWGVALYWWAGLLYALQVRQILRTMPRSKR